MMYPSMHPQIKRCTSQTQPTNMVYGIGDSVFGSVMLAVSPLGDSTELEPEASHSSNADQPLNNSAEQSMAITWLSFIDENAQVGVSLDDSLAQMQHYWSGVKFSRDDYYIQPSLNACLTAGAYQPSLMVHGSDYQLRVWQALLMIPNGETASYKQLATTLGNEKGARAIGGAVGANPISLLIPCHRIIRQDGESGQYRWGVKIKEKLLSFEQRNKPTSLVYTDGMSGC